MFDVKEIVQHAEARIAAAIVHDEPFPYIVVRDLLPADFYRALLVNWPTQAAFRHTNSQYREQILLKQALQHMADESAATWQLLSAAGPAINRALVLKFRHYFPVKFSVLLGRKWREILARDFQMDYSVVNLAQYSGVSKLDPHVDHATLPVNSFLYVSESQIPEPDLGTVLYRSFGFGIADNNAKWSQEFIDRTFAAAKIVPYQANTIVAFLNGSTSFHGVRPFDIGTRLRRLVLFSPKVVGRGTDLEHEFKQGALEIDGGDGASPTQQAEKVNVVLAPT